MSEPVKIAIAGLGTVGAELVRLLRGHAELLERRGGHAIEVVAISARDRSRDRGIDLSPYTWFDDAGRMAAETDADIVVELIGGSDGIARTVCETALGRGLDVVTANKALLAEHGSALAALADAKGARLAYEAAVAGGIPIVKALREGLGANVVERVYGILNGTCNYILTKMEATGRSFEDVLAEAQALGYAEADPSFDVDGIDTAHKLAILAALAFGTRVDFDAVYCEGIRHISAEDIVFARELGYRIKLLGIARLTDFGMEQRVHPCMVRLGAPIALVDDVLNAVVVDGDAVGSALFEGRGAGAGPTASAVAADILDLVRGGRLPAFAIPAAELAEAKSSPIDRHWGAYYVRLNVVDQPGVIAAIANAMRDQQVSMEQMIQRARAPGESVPVVLTTHETVEASMKRALQQIAALDTVVQSPCLIRIEPL